MTGQHLAGCSERTPMHHLTICIYSVFRPQQYSLPEKPKLSADVLISLLPVMINPAPHFKKFECFWPILQIHSCKRADRHIHQICLSRRKICRKKIIVNFKHCDPEASAKTTWTICAAQFSSQCRKHDAVSVSTLLYGAAPQQQWVHKSS